MSIASTDLKNYQSASNPEDDVSTTGGAVSLTGIIDDMVLAAADALKVRSSAAGDAAGTTCTITGRDATGAIVSENHALNGVSPVTFTTTFERILKVVLTGTTTVGIVTVYRADNATVVVALPIAKTSCRRLFYDSASAVGALTRYEKIFWKNEHGTLALLSATVTLTADPSAKIKIGQETSVNGSATIANRLAVPSGPTFVDDSIAQSVPGGSLAAGAVIGVWIEQDLLSNDIAYKSTFTTQLAGNSV
jgi:hypothetical protein